MSDNSIAAWIVAGGGGTLVGSIAVAAIQAFGKHGRDRAEAADLATTAAGRVIERLERENVRMREAIIAITEVLDTVIDDLPVDNPQKAKLRKANKAAKMAAV